MTSYSNQLCNNLIVGHPLRPEQFCLQLPTPYLMNDAPDSKFAALENISVSCIIINHCLTLSIQPTLVYIFYGTGLT